MSDIQTFSALLVEELGDKQFTQKIVKRSITELPDNEVVIEVHYSSLNYKDALSASGNRAVTKNYPHTPGIDAAGTVVSDKSATFAAGDEVLVFGYDLGMNTPGGLGQYISVPADWIVKCPSSLTLKEAMCYGTGGLTAALCVEKLERMGARPSDGSVAVTGATGGVGSLSIALLKQLGYSVVAFSGKPEQSEHLKAIGADEVIHRDVINEVNDKPIGTPVPPENIIVPFSGSLFAITFMLQFSRSDGAGNRPVPFCKRTHPETPIMLGTNQMSTEITLWSPRAIVLPDYSRTAEYCGLSLVSAHGEQHHSFAVYLLRFFWALCHANVVGV